MRSQPDANPFRAAALEALAEAVLLMPDRKKELEGNAERWVEAYTFYCKQNEILKKKDLFPVPNNVIGSQVMGIDFNHPIIYGKVPPSEKLDYENAQKVKTTIGQDFVQFQCPDDKGYPPKDWGNYMTVPGVTPEQLGLSPIAKVRDSNQPRQASPSGANEKRTAYELAAPPTAEPVDCIISTAARITDTWSRREGWHPGAKVVPVITPGGGLQIFSPLAKTIMTLKPGQEKGLTQEEKYEAGFERMLTRQATSAGLKRQLSEKGPSTEADNEATRPGPRRP